MNQKKLNWPEGSRRLQADRLGVDSHFPCRPWSPVESVAGNLTRIKKPLSDGDLRLLFKLEMNGAVKQLLSNL